MKRWSAIVLILLWLGWHFSVPIDLTSVDVGRHIKNGELIVHGTWDVLYKNYYSFSHPDYPYINHQWLFGVFCFCMWHLFGFFGLSLIYVGLVLLTFWLFFRWAESKSSFLLALAFGLLSIPLLAYRNEIRPEGFSMLFCALFWFFGDAYLQGRLKVRELYFSLILLEIFWVNTQIYFLLGPLLVFLLWFQAKLDNKKDQASTFKKVFLLVSMACLINPSGLAGVLLPFNILNGLGYRVVEDQSLFFILRNYSDNSIQIYFLGTLLLAAIAWIAVIKREGIRKHVALVILMLIFSVAGIKMVRLIAPYGFFWIPLTAYAWGRWMENWSERFKKVTIAILIVAGILVSAMVHFNWKQGPILGLAPGVNRAAEFLKQEKLTGPIFSNYAIGGYLIFHLGSEQKFFVDNRVEAYPSIFFKKIFLPMLGNDAIWQTIEERFHFNIICFSRNGLSRWGSRFIVRRLNDFTWAPVFIDDYTIILLKRNAQNADVIGRYQWHASKLTAGNTEGYRLDRSPKI
ncbi:MAG: hypothetical protein WCH62_02445 [Candidatus Omnitrophota bacterium]